jgi:hypothetical protein
MLRDIDEEITDIANKQPCSHGDCLMAAPNNKRKEDMENG